LFGPPLPRVVRAFGPGRGGVGVRVLLLGWEGCWILCGQRNGWCGVWCGQAVAGWLGDTWRAVIGGGAVDKAKQSGG